MPDPIGQQGNAALPPEFQNIPNAPAGAFSQVLQGTASAPTPDERRSDALLVGGQFLGDPAVAKAVADLKAAAPGSDITALSKNVMDAVKNASTGYLTAAANSSDPAISKAGQAMLDIQNGVAPAGTNASQAAKDLQAAVQSSTIDPTIAAKAAAIKGTA